jgi:HAD-superfamily hydrolase, subfamily IIB
MNSNNISKTLYVSDLDGTLLDSDASISERSLNILNSLIDQGILFTVATARTITSTRIILKDLHLNLPIILMNGVCIYDPVKEKYIHIETFSREELSLLINLTEEYNLKGFMYALKNDNLTMYYEDLSHKALKDFYDERAKSNKNRFVRVDKFSVLTDEPVIYFVLLDYKENLEHIYQLTKNLPNINSAFYLDNYYKDTWYLEIFPGRASKFRAVQFLRKYLSVNYVIGFGDNQNDISLSEACDEFYAVENAVDELKLKSDRIIGKNTEDGVALWMQQNICLSK